MAQPPRSPFSSSRQMFAYKIDDLLAAHPSDYDLYLHLLDLLCKPYHAGASAILTREEQWIVHTGEYMCLSCANGFDDQILNVGFASFRIAVEALQAFGPPAFRDPALQAVDLMRRHGILLDAATAQDDFWAVHDTSGPFQHELQELALPLFSADMHSLYGSAGHWIREHAGLFRLPERPYETAVG